MNLLDVLEDKRLDKRKERIYGVVVGIVTNNEDPEKLGRVKVKFPWLSDENESTWARISTPMAGKERGIYVLPEVDDEVLVVFEQGDIRYPYILGSLWNGKDSPPAQNDDGKNNVRLIKSRSGHIIRLNDKEGEEMIEIIDKTGTNSIVIDSANNTLNITAGTIVLNAENIEIISSADTLIEASGTTTIVGNTLVDINP